MFQINKLSFKKYFTCLLLIVACCLITLSSTFAKSDPAETNNTEKKVQEEINKDNSSSKQGLTVHIDPDTGELISPPEEVESLAQPNNAVINNAPDEETVIIDNPDGSKTFIYPDSHQFTNKIKIDENGKVISECGREHE